MYVQLGKQAASVKGINIVSVNWIVDSIASSKCLKELGYLHATSPQSPSPTSSVPLKRQTRSQAQSQSQSQSQSQPQVQPQVQPQSQPQPQPQAQAQAQTKTAKKNNKRALNSPDDSVAMKKAKPTNQPPAKKQKDNKKEKKLTIPVDECFGRKGAFSGYQLM